MANPAVVSINAEPDFSIYEGESLELFIEDPINGAQYDGVRESKVPESLLKLSMIHHTP